MYCVSVGADVAVAVDSMVELGSGEGVEIIRVFVGDEAIITSDEGPQPEMLIIEIRNNIEG